MEIIIVMIFLTLSFGFAGMHSNLKDIVIELRYRNRLLEEQIINEEKKKPL